MNNKKTNNIIIIIGMAIFLALFYTGVHNSEFNTSGSIFGINFNIFIFLFSIVISFVVYLGLASLSKQIEIPDKYTNRQIILYNAIYIIFIVGILYYLCRVYSLETSLHGGDHLNQMYIREAQSTNHIAYIIITLIIISGMAIVIRNTGKLAK